MQSHAFHLAFTATIGLAIYQGVIAAARNAEHIDLWTGILMIAAIAVLLLPVLAIPFIFGGIRAKRMKYRLSPDLVKVRSFQVMLQKCSRLPQCLSSFHPSKMCGMQESFTHKGSP